MPNRRGEDKSTAELLVLRTVCRESFDFQCMHFSSPIGVGESSATSLHITSYHSSLLDTTTLTPQLKLYYKFSILNGSHF